MKKLFATLFATAMMAALPVQGTATAATSGEASPAGWPTGCTHGKNGANGWLAYCTSHNGGRFKATVICAPQEGGPYVNRDATSWSQTTVSYVYCPPLTAVISGGYIERSY
ncbi:hypothetical protein [Streptomyces sp. NPDC095613]|uniref:hypothetical protein n=1 Tax=Streptomyces sp. NPDC095613 TaxID=3155540 RepID=UPI003332C1E4